MKHISGFLKARCGHQSQPEDRTTKSLNGTSSKFFFGLGQGTEVTRLDAVTC